MCEVTITGIPAGVKRVLLEHYRIDETHSNAYTAWKNMGSPQAPTPEQYGELKAAGQLQLPHFARVARRGKRKSDHRDVAARARRCPCCG